MSMIILPAMLRLLLVAVATLAGSAHAQIPISAPAEDGLPVTFSGAVQLGDPLRKSISIYGTLSPARDVDLYVIRPGSSGVIPVEIRIPVRTHNAEFRPRLVVLGSGIGVPARLANLPIAVPDGLGTMEFSFELREPDLHWDWRTLERTMLGRDIRVPATAGEPYYLLVHEPDGSVGTYSLIVGEGSEATFPKSFQALRSLAGIKMGLTDDAMIAWTEWSGALVVIGGIFLAAGALAFAVQPVHRTARSCRKRMAAIGVIGCAWIIIACGILLLQGPAWLSGVATFQALALIPIGIGAIGFAGASRRQALLAFVLCSGGLLLEVILLFWHLIVTR